MSRKHAFSKISALPIAIVCAAYLQYASVQFLGGLDLAKKSRFPSGAACALHLELFSNPASTSCGVLQ